MDMIIHQTPSQTPRFRTFQCSGQNLDIGSPVVIAKEYLLLPVPTLGNMVGNARDNDADSAWNTLS
jgi:hypothetical protein